MSPDRRTFLGCTAAALGAASLPEVASPAPAPRAARRALDAGLLRAVAEAVLPESLAARAREEAVAAFEAWLDGLEPVAELVHPYGGSEIPYGPPDPEPAWSAQLQALELLAQAREGMAFAELGAARRRAMLEAQIEDRGAGFPAPARARHVAVGLMAHYYRSASAIDRAYGVRIGRRVCRGLEGVGDRPEPLEE